MGVEGVMVSGFLGDSIRGAVEAGVRADYFAYFLILPFLVSLMAAARHLLGLATYGTFLPVLMAMVWAQMGFVLGLGVFLFLLAWAWLVRGLVKKTLIRRFRVNYLPRMAILLVLVMLGALALSLIPRFRGIVGQTGWPLAFLVMVLLVQNLMEAQMTLSKKESREMLLQTGFFALLGFLLLSWRFLQGVVLRFPGGTIVTLLVFNIYVGRFVGFRLFEYRRFKSVVKK